MLNLNPHMIDVLAHSHDREHLILPVNRALDFVSYLNDEVFEDDNYAFFDPFCKSAELLLAVALQSARYRSVKSVAELAVQLYAENKFYALCPDSHHHYLSKKAFCGDSFSRNSDLHNADFLKKDGRRLDRRKFRSEFKKMLATINNKKVVIICALPCQQHDEGIAKPIYEILISALLNKKIAQLLVMIPERWFSGRKNLSDFREIKSGTIKYLRVKNSRWLFPCYDTREGLCFLYGVQGDPHDAITIDNGVKKLTVALPKPFWKNLFTVHQTD